MNGILEKGSIQRQKADTPISPNSPRSHTIFSITADIKEYAHDGEELVKTGKIHFVNLANVTIIVEGWQLQPVPLDLSLRHQDFVRRDPKHSSIQVGLQ